MYKDGIIQMHKETMFSNNGSVIWIYFTDEINFLGCVSILIYI